MSNPAWLIAEIDAHIREQPPYDVSPPEDLIHEIAQEIINRFDYTELYDQIDKIAAQVFRERGLTPENQSGPGSTNT